jgi:serine/threonine protein kinase
MALEAGSKLGPYEIVSLTGAGGMGEVYKAKDTRLNRTVAIKVLPSHLTASDEIKRRFEQEAKAISSLNHPNICILHDIGEQDGTAYLVMEYLEGQTLSEKILEGPLTNDELIEYSLQIVDALDKAHKQGLVHRDLKPANVMLTKEGAKLLDFGLAKLQVPTGGFEEISGVTKTSTPLTQQGTILGTIQYMSPEQLEGAEADARSDIFAFGGMLFEMVTGQRAFNGKSQASLIASVLKEEPKSVSEIQPLAPPMFERVIKRCLAKEADDRWQTAGDLKHAIEWMVDGGSQVGIPKALSTKRKRQSTMTIVLAALLFISTAYLAFIHFTRPVEEKIISRFTVDIEQGLTNISWPRISPDGKLIAFRATDSIGTRQIWIRPLNSLESYPLFGTEGVNRHYWSPDSKFLTFFDGTKLMKIPVTGGQSQLLCDGVDGADCSWGSKDVILFDGNTGDPLRMVSANGGQINTTAEVDTSSGETFIGWPWFLPDGENFIFVASTLDSAGRTVSKIKLGSINSPDSRILHELKRDVRIEFSPDGFILFVQDNNLMALPFDDKVLEVKGEAKPIAQQVSFSGNAEAFGMSDNGTLLYHSSNTNATSQFVWVDREGKELSKVGAIGNYLDANLSPDETKLVYAMQETGSSDNDIWVYDLIRNVATKFTFDAQNEVWPIWSPDGETILYASNKNGSYDIFEKDITGVEEQRLVYRNDSGQVGPGTFTPDGERLFFTYLRGNRDIGILHLNDSNRVDMFANTSFSEQMAEVSPNGKFVAYISAESGRLESYVRQLDGRGRKWQISNEGAVFPRWRADGNELYYYSLSGEIIAIPVKTEGSFEAGNPSVLFQATLQRRIGFQIGPYDVSKDGQRFLLNASLSGTSSRKMIIVLNMSEQI